MLNLISKPPHWTSLWTKLPFWTSWLNWVTSFLTPSLNICTKTSYWTSPSFLTAINHTSLLNLSSEVDDRNTRRTNRQESRPGHSHLMPLHTLYIMVHMSVCLSICLSVDSSVYLHYKVLVGLLPMAYWCTYITFCPILQSVYLT